MPRFGAGPCSPRRRLFRHARLWRPEFAQARASSSGQRTRIASSGEATGPLGSNRGARYSRYRWANLNLFEDIQSRIFLDFKKLYTCVDGYVVQILAGRYLAAAVTARAKGRGNGTGTASHPIYKLKAELFRTLGHPVRVRILELLREDERTVGDLQAALELDSSGTSQHLSALRRQGLVDSRREGTSVYYRIKDPRTLQLLEVARQILTSTLEETQALLGELALALPPASRPGGASGRGR